MLQDFMRVYVVTRRLGYLVLCIIKSVVYCILVNLTGKFIECLKFIHCYSCFRLFSLFISAAIRAPASASNLIASSVLDVMLENSTSISARRIILPMSPNRPPDTNNLLCLSAISSIPVFMGFYFFFEFFD